jgi:hypothetical protein
MEWMGGFERWSRAGRVTPNCNNHTTTMNAKLRSDSVFTQLTSEQIELLEDWLFEEKLGYKEVIEKLEKELGVKTSQTALGRYFRRLAGERTQEWRVETIAQCLETLATAKGDGTLQAGLFVMANMQAVRLMTEEKPSFRELTAWLRAMTSAGIFETRRVELQETRAQQRRADIERKEKEAREKEENARWSAEYNARYETREVKRKATIAAKKVEVEAKAKAEAAKVETKVLATNATEATSPRPNGFPSPPQDSSPMVDERFALSGPPEAERVTDGVAGATEHSVTVAVAEPPEGGTPNVAPGLEVLATKAVEEFDYLTEGERNGDFAINRAGNAP